MAYNMATYEMLYEFEDHNRRFLVARAVARERDLGDRAVTARVPVRAAGRDTRGRWTTPRLGEAAIVNVGRHVVGRTARKSARERPT